MSLAVIQRRSLILPQFWQTGLEYEDIADLVEHTSIEFYIADIHEKRVSIIAIENVAVGAPGSLWWWVELSSVPTTTSGAYWAAINGGGGAIIPTIPNILVGTGVTGTAQPDMIAWTMHSEYARVVVQTPINAGLPGDYWQVQVIVEGKN